MANPTGHHDAELKAKVLSAKIERLYLITFGDGSTQEEYGKDEADVREFLRRSFAHKGEPDSVVLAHPYDEEM